MGVSVILRQNQYEEMNCNESYIILLPNMVHIVAYDNFILTQNAVDVKYNVWQREENVTNYEKRVRERMRRIIMNRFAVSAGGVWALVRTVRLQS